MDLENSRRRFRKSFWAPARRLSDDILPDAMAGGPQAIDPEVARRRQSRQSVLSHAREDFWRAPDFATLSWRRRATAEYPQPST